MNKWIRLWRYEWPMHFVLLLTNWLPNNVFFLRLRGMLATPFFKQCGKNLRLGRSLTFVDPFEMEIGNNEYIAQGNWFNASAGITIGDEVMFGPKSIIVTSNHSMINGSYRYGPSITQPIEIGYGSWIGGGCAILSGVTIGKGCLIAANAVVNKSVADYHVVGGNPAKTIKIVSPA